jgi:hypothetical protein
MGLAERLLKRLVVAAGLCWTLPLHAADPVQVQVVGRAQIGAPLQLMVSGIWPDACPPRLDAVEMQEAEPGTALPVLVRLHAAEGGCMKQATAFAVPVEIGNGGWKQPVRIRLLTELLQRDGGTITLAFNLIEVGLLPPLLPEAGFWWSERGGDHERGGPGQAILIEPQGDRLGATVMGYGPGGAPEWYFGSGQLRRQSAGLGLMRLAGGAGPLADYRPPAEAEEMGMLWLELHGGARATAWFVQPSAAGGVTVQPYSMVRFRLGDWTTSAWSGRWLLELEGETPRVIELKPALEAGVAPHLVAGADGSRLSCEGDAKRPNSPPSLCRLEDARQRPIAAFTDIGLNRLRGFHAGGGEASLARLPD